MSDGNLQSRTFLYHFSHLTNLSFVVSQTHGEYQYPFFHQLEYGHQRGKRLMHAMTRKGNTLQSSLTDGLCLVNVPSHAHTEETVWVLLLHLLQVGILTAVYQLLYHDGSTHLSVVHVREKHLGSILAINHERR